MEASLPRQEWTKEEETRFVHAMPAIVCSAMTETLTITLISDVFCTANAQEHLAARLAAAAGTGTDLAVLPELSCNPWSAATRDARASDAEPLGGPRCSMQAAASAEVGIGLLGSAIIADEDGTRHNTALLWDAGELIGTYRKHHLPDEPGFFETDHYEPAPAGDGLLPLPFRGWSLGVQICSDMNRPLGTHALAAAGAEVILGPRATEAATWQRWKPVLIANARTACCYVCSVNRPCPEQGVLLGGPSLGVDPDGGLLVETTDTLATFTACRDVLAKARRAYPGYLPLRNDVYAAAYAALAEGTDP